MPVTTVIAMSSRLQWGWGSCRTLCDSLRCDAGMAWLATCQTLMMPMMHIHWAHLQGCRLQQFRHVLRIAPAVETMSDLKHHYVHLQTRWTASLDSHKRACRPVVLFTQACRIVHPAAAHHMCVFVVVLPAAVKAIAAAQGSSGVEGLKVIEKAKAAVSSIKVRG